MRALVLGDIILDSFLKGIKTRQSPEADAPILLHDSTKYVAGGASNVALNLHSLGWDVSLMGLVGKDEQGERLSNLLATYNNLEVISFSDGRPTTHKQRILVDGVYQMRVDVESTLTIDTDLVEYVLQKLEAEIKKDLDILVVQDYNKGLLTSDLIKGILSLAKEARVDVVVDPKRDNFWHYKEVTIFKPNRKELAEANQIDVAALTDLTNLEDVMRKSKDKLQCDQLIVTLSEAGIAALDRNNTFHYQSAISHSITDVCGAGDSVFAAVIDATKNILDTEEVLHRCLLAGKAACSIQGTYVLRPEDLEENS
ncbi:MAG TPA: hypothetical protein DCF84_01230 [Bacteroidetes bacterium]|nr:hypothetical protein [Bacteroidota bacterium]|tara:strand:+ start:475 stop:1410 length:936 start_codon:yes stop_codon:yes gene_type:complete